MPVNVSLLDLVDEPALDMAYRWLSLNGTVDRSKQILQRGLKHKDG